MEPENATPQVFAKTSKREESDNDYNDEVEDSFDSREIFDLIRSINDPEHPLSLEELNVVRLDQIHVDNSNSTIKVQFTPTIPHCSMASLIGLSIRVKLMRVLPARFKVDVEIFPGTHASCEELNKQLGDKERVAAALENTGLLSVVNQCIATPPTG
eukprot:m.76897 g.76897  ORF g.76897 m.76897 type:complete len:157 (+) comp14442_c2_seq16:1662-2132(+)